jgi:D-3-phosphoglycerate dehydrogenase
VRKIPAHDKRVRAGEWDIASSDPVWRTKGKTLGLLGFGNIARTLARKVSGLELRILAFDPYVDAKTAAEAGAELVDLETLFAESDYISIHAPLTDETKHVIDAAALEKMRPNAILVNTSRGGLVDAEALAEALKSGAIGVAALDVYETEPPGPDSPLFALENAILTDHAAWYTEESQLELQTKAARQVALALAGDEPTSVVNAKALAAAGRPARSPEPR